jgi:hypothetical protein
MAGSIPIARKLPVQNTCGSWLANRRMIKADIINTPAGARAANVTTPGQLPR